MACWFDGGHQNDISTFVRRVMGALSFLHCLQTGAQRRGGGIISQKSSLELRLVLLVGDMVLLEAT